MNRAPTRNGNRFFVATGFVETGFVETDFVELVLWERNLLRDRDRSQTHRPMNRAPTGSQPDPSPDESGSLN